VLTHGNSIAFLIAHGKMMAIGANLEENYLSHFGGRQVEMGPNTCF
jgi:hypothetical protein